MKYFLWPQWDEVKNQKEKWNRKIHKSEEIKHHSQSKNKCDHIIAVFILRVTPQCLRDKVQAFGASNAWDCHLSSHIPHHSIILLSMSLLVSCGCPELVCGPVQWLSKHINLLLCCLGFRFLLHKTRGRRRPDPIPHMFWICIDCNMLIRFQRLPAPPPRAAAV